ncbi:hypothetical protein ACHAXM_006316 [Skeletonema potamos]|jgi:hypothetical protein
MSMSQDKSNRPDQGRKYRPAGLLCSSCDQCRAKKIKCDGKKPCDACKKSYARKNNSVRIDGANLRSVRIECVYSPAKKRGPSIRHVENTETEKEGHVQDKKQRENSEEHPTPTATATGLGQIEMLMPSTADHNNNNVKTTLMNPAAAAFTLDFLPQNHQAAGGNPLMHPPTDPMSAAVQQSFPSLSSGSTLGIQGGMTMAQGASRGHDDIVSDAATSTTTQQLVYMQQQQQSQQQIQIQQQLQHFLQQSMQLSAMTEQGDTTRGAESSMSSSVEPLQSETERLRRRVNELETENARLKEKLTTLMLQAKETKDKD